MAQRVQRHAIPRWTIGSVLLGVIATIAISVAVDTATADDPLDAGRLDRYLLQPGDDLGGLDHVASFRSPELALDRRSGATGSLTDVFSDLDIEPGSTIEALVNWSPGHEVVVSEVLSFESADDASDHLAAVWSQYALGAFERQRGPDGSLLMFHPDFERGEGVQIAPVAVAAWGIGSDVLMVTHLGADSSQDSLRLARIMEEHRTAGPDR